MSADRRPITADGARRLRQELDDLWRIKRPETTRRVTAAAALGDRSENADYQYNKKQLREIDRRIRYLRQAIERMQVVDRLPSDTERIFFGAWIHLQDDEGTEHRLRIVGADEIDPRQGWISINSPVARALLKHRATDRVTVHLGDSTLGYKVLSVSYQAPDTPSPAPPHQSNQ